MYSTIIIGAGPIGSYLAEKLTQLGHNVLVLEKKAAAGQDICCTGIISKECHDLLNLYDRLKARHANSAKFFAPSGRSLRLQRDDEVAYIIDRPALDRLLANRAQTAGAEYLFTTEVTTIESGTSCLRVNTNRNGQNNVFETKTAIIATGYGSDLPRKLGLGKITNFIIGAQTEVTINEVDEVEIYLDQKLAPGGFAWLVPTRDDKGLAGLMTFHQHKWHLNQLLSKLEIQGKISPSEVTNNYGAIPLRPLPRTYNDRILVVGEAAGQVKPTTGGGIHYGIVCANIAASVLHQALTTDELSATRLSTYQKHWRTELIKELTIGYWMQRIWRKLSNKHIEYLFTIADHKGIPERIHTTKNFSFDRHSKLVIEMAGSVLSFAKSKKQL